MLLKLDVLQNFCYLCGTVLTLGTRLMKITANDIRVGNLLEYEKKLWLVYKTSHTQPGKGGAFIQVEMKDIKAGTKKNVRFRSSESVEKARLDQKAYQYLYDEGDTIALMDDKTFEQISASKNLLGEKGCIPN